MEPLDNMDDLLPGFLQKKGGKTSPSADGFRLPDGYFEKLGDRFFERTKADGLENPAGESLFLGEIKTVGDGLSLPENYFEKLPDRVLEKIGADGLDQKLAENQPVPTGKRVELTKNRPFFNILKNPSALAAAASMAVLVAALGFFFNKKTVGTPGPIACNSTCLSEKISAEDVQFYLSENLSEFSPEELAAEGLLGEMNFPAAKKTDGPDVDADDAAPALREMLDDISAEELEEML